MADIYSLSTAASSKEQFLEVIRPKTLKRIKFPELFYEEYVKRKHRGEFVTLISPLSTRQWKVRRVGCRLKEGWKEFVIAHRLRAKDHVLFTHEGNFVFSVTTFSPRGLRYRYVSQNKPNQHRNETGSLHAEKRKFEHVTNEVAENSSRVKGKAGVVIKDDGNLSARRKSIRIDKNTSPVEKDCFIQIVTEANVKNNSVYIPTKFATENNLVGKNTNILALVNINNDSWGCKIRQCTDKRLKICGGWKDFCETNNLQANDCCKFRIRSDTEHIVLDLVDVTTNGKKPDGVTIPSTPAVPCKEEECEFGEEEYPANDVDVEMINMEAFYKFSAKNLKSDKGQSSRN